MLLIKRARAPRAGQWALPGGLLELGETLFEAASREVREETSLTVWPYRIITALDLIERDDAGKPRYHYTLVEIAAEYRSGELLAGDDATEAGWFEPDEIARLDAWEQVEKMVRLSEMDQHLPAGV